MTRASLELTELSERFLRAAAACEPSAHKEGLLGHLALAGGQTGESLSHYILAAQALPRFSHWVNVAKALRGDHPDTFVRVERFEGAEIETVDDALRFVLGGFDELARAEQEDARERVDITAAALAGAHARIARVARLALVLEDDELRFAVALLWRKLEQRRYADAANDAATQPAIPWVFARDGSSFTPPGVNAVTIARRKAMRNIVALLARVRVERPGESVTHDELIECGWPGDRSHRASALNRLTFSISTLRKMGLRPILETVSGGYRMNPAIPLEWNDEAQVESGPIRYESDIRAIVGLRRSS